MKRWLRMSYLVAGVGGLGFFVMSVLLLAVWPGRVLEQQIRGMSPEHPLALTASEQRGRVDLRPGRLRLLPHAADPLPAQRRGAVRRGHFGLGDASSIIRICGARAGSGRICRAKEPCVRPTGSSRISIRRERWWRSR